MKRSGFKVKPRAARQAKQIDYQPRARPVAVADARARMTVAVPMPKESPARSEPYLRAVATLPCSHCHRHAPSQAAHADEGKGLGIKADDRTAFPLCADSPGRLGCHSIIGASGAFRREHRRHLERVYGARTRQTIRELGLWPANLPEWPGDSPAETPGA